LAAQRIQTTRSTEPGRALVVAKGHAVTAYRDEILGGVKLRTRRTATRRCDAGAYHAGRAAADRVGLGRPITTAAGPRAISQ
jgi:hypothetical protein